MNNENKLTLSFDRSDIYPWPFMFADEVLTKEIGKLAAGKKCSQILEEYKNGHFYYYTNQSETDAIAYALLSKVEHDKKFYNQVLRNIRKYSKCLVQFSDQVLKADYTEARDTLLLKVVKDYVQNLKTLRCWGWIPAIIDGFTTPILSDYCLKKLSTELPQVSDIEIKTIFSALTTPSVFGQVQQSEIDKCLLVKKIGRKTYEAFRTNKNSKEAFNILNKNQQKLLLSYIKKYIWITYNYEGPALTIDLFHKNISVYSYDYILGEYRQIIANKKEAIKAKKLIFKKNKFSKALMHIIDVATNFLILKEYRKAVYQYSYVAMDKPLGEIAKRAGVDLETIKFLNLSEIKEILKKKDASQYKNRKQYLLIKIEKGISHFLDNTEAKNILHSLVQDEEVLDSDFKGQTAYPGDVTGRAKIVLTVNDLRKMNEGDILLSSSTNPDLLSAMKKAGAIVTEMGGIICHAAIVSRELKIPCVVGVKKITKHIKDGDLIRVDARNGFIEKLNK